MTERTQERESMEDTDLKEEITAKEEIKAEEATVLQAENTSTEEIIEEKPMTESEFLEAQKEALKKNIRIWTGVLIYLLVAGLVLCLIVYGIAMVTMFVINLLSFLKTKKLLDRLENGEVSVKEIYEYYQAMSRRSPKLFVINIFFGGIFGVIGTMNDMKVSENGMSEGLKILGEDYKNERVANDPKAQWKYCIYCKRNKTEAYYLYKMTDGMICSSCLSKYSSMLPKREEDPALPSLKVANYIRPEKSLGKLSSKDLEERYEYLKKNQEEYSGFTPTKVICDGCLELDETNSLFRIAKAGDFDSDKAGVSSGLVHPYSAVKGIAYEMIYEYEHPDDHTNGGWRYKDLNSIVFAIDDNPYLKEETFTLKKIPTGFFANSKKPQIEYAEQTVNELKDIFNKPVLEKRKLHR